MPLPPPSRQVFARPATEDYSLATVLHPLSKNKSVKRRINYTTYFCVIVLILWGLTMIWL